MRYLRYVLVFTGIFLTSNSFASSSMRLGPKLQVFVDSSVSISPLRVSFSVIVHDATARDAYLEVPRAHEVLILTNTGFSARYVLASVFANPKSPTYTFDTIEIDLPNDASAKDFKISVLSIHEKCMNFSVSECSELEIGEQGSFYASELQLLEKSTIYKVLQ